jgi:hypothetical protein
MQSAIHCLPSGSDYLGRPALERTARTARDSLGLKGAVYAASNGGNRASVPAQAAPAVWASGTADGQQSATDYAFAAVGTRVSFGKAVAKAFFGNGP